MPGRGVTVSKTNRANQWLKKMGCHNCFWKQGGMREEGPDLFWVPCFFREGSRDFSLEGEDTGWVEQIFCVENNK